MAKSSDKNKATPKSQASPAAKSIRRPQIFRPAFTMLLLYFAGFFFFFALLLILPDMLTGADMLPAGLGEEETKAAGERLAQRVAAKRLAPAFFLTVASLGLGSYYRVLPGLRPPG